MSSRKVISSDKRLFHWLQARRFAAEELFQRRRITSKELSRIVVDANMGQYTGPMEFKDGSVSKEEAKVGRLLNGE